MYFYFLVCLFLVKSCFGARILAIFPAPSISHQMIYRPLMLELAKRGHELVILTTDPVFAKGESPANYTEIDVHDMSYAAWKENLQVSRGKQEDIYAQIMTGFKVMHKVFVKQVRTPEFQQVLKSEKKFDLLFVEGLVRPARILSHILNVPAIFISCAGAFGDVYKVFGMSTHPLLYPAVTRQRLENLTFWEKLKELYSTYKFESIWKEIYEVEDELVEEIFGPNMLKLEEVSNNLALALINTHSLWDNNRPVPPNVVYVGGVHQKPQEELPTELQHYLDTSKHGVIYLSFGTNVIPSQLPFERIQILINVFSQLPYDVLWKWDKDELPGKSDNIKLFKWLPQSDLLRHPKIKLFITHGGLQSTSEAITAGVPLIGMPMLSDQWYNVETYLKHKIGLRLDLNEVTEEKLKEYIDHVIFNDSYRQNMARLRDQINDQPQSSLERAVWWTEHVLRHGGGKHLRPAGANISWSQYLELPVVLTLLAIVLVILAVFICAILYLYNVLSSFRTSFKIKSS